MAANSSSSTSSSSSHIFIIIYLGLICSTILVSGFPTKCEEICDRSDREKYSSQNCKEICDTSDRDKYLPQECNKCRRCKCYINGLEKSENLSEGQPNIKLLRANIVRLWNWIWVLIAINILTGALFALLCFYLYINKAKTEVKKKTDERPSQTKLLEIISKQHERNIPVTSKPNEKVDCVTNNQNGGGSTIQTNTIKDQHNQNPDLSTTPPKLRQHCNTDSINRKRRQPSESYSPEDLKDVQSAYYNRGMSSSTNTLPDSTVGECRSSLYTGLSTATLNTTLSNNESELNNNDNNTTSSTISPGCSPQLRNEGRCISTQL